MPASTRSPKKGSTDERTKTGGRSRGMLASLGPDTALAQAASEEVKRACRQTTSQVASMIESAKRRGPRDLEQGVRKPSRQLGRAGGHHI